jgi:predicted nucleic-acid-binding protein
MIGLDTNILVRYLAQDDPRQSLLANKLVESLTDAAPGFVSLVVLMETVWVLESRYDADADKIAQVLETLLHVEGFEVEQAETAWRSLRRFKAEGGDFSDTLIATLARDKGCHLIYSFDKRATKLSGMTLLK